MKILKVLLLLILSHSLSAQEIPLGPYIEILSTSCEAEQLCLPINRTSENEIEVWIDDLPYTSGFTECTSEVILFQGFTIPDSGMDGPYTFSWEFHGITYSGVFQDLDDLIVKMNEIDPAKPWFLSNSVFITSHNTSLVVGSMNVEQTQTGITAFLNPSTSMIPALAMEIPPNTTEITIIKDFFEQTATIEFKCVEQGYEDIQILDVEAGDVFFVDFEDGWPGSNPITSITDQCNGSPLTLIEEGPDFGITIYAGSPSGPRILCYNVSNGSESFTKTIELTVIPNLSSEYEEDVSLNVAVDETIFVDFEEGWPGSNPISNIIDVCDATASNIADINIEEGPSYGINIEAFEVGTYVYCFDVSNGSDTFRKTIELTVSQDAISAYQETVFLTIGIGETVFVNFEDGYPGDVDEVFDVMSFNEDAMGFIYESIEWDPLGVSLRGEAPGNVTLEYFLEDDGLNTFVKTINVTITSSTTGSITFENTSLVPSIASCDEIISDQVTASTVCAGGEVTIVRNFYERNEQCPGTYELVREYTATDDCGNEETFTQVIQIEDLQIPEFTNTADPLEVQFLAASFDDDIAEWINLHEASDNCSETDLSNNYSSGLINVNGPEIYSINFTAVDECGNSSVYANDIIVDYSEPIEVWPGDTDQNQKVEVVDLFNIGFGYDQTGPVRANASTEWMAQEVFPWNGESPDGVNFAHADCNGDGIINSLDTNAITLNLGEEYGFQDNNSQSRMDFPVRIELQEVLNDDELIFGIYVGNENTSFEDLFGLHLQIEYPENIVDANSVFMLFPATWFGQSPMDMIQVQNKNLANGIIDFAVVKIDHQGEDGHGKIAEFSCRLKEEYQNSVLDFPIQINASSGVFLNGEVFNTSPFETTISLDPNSIAEKALESSIKIISNPVRETLRVSVPENIRIEEARIYDINGILQLQNISLPQNVSMLTAGHYYIQLFTNEGVVVKKFVLIE